MVTAQIQKLAIAALAAFAFYGLKSGFDKKFF
jgi:hypothetical protein